MALGIFGKSTKNVDKVEETLSTGTDDLNIEDIDFGVGDLSKMEDLGLAGVDMSGNVSENEGLSEALESQNFGELTDVSSLGESDVAAPKFEGTNIDAVLDGLVASVSSSVNTDADIVDEEGKTTEETVGDTALMETVAAPHFETSVDFDASVTPEVSEQEVVFEEPSEEELVVKETGSVSEEIPTAYSADNVVSADADTVSEAVSGGYDIGSSGASKPELVFGLAMSGEAGYAVWYSGFADTQYFNVTKQTSDMMIQGTDTCKAIHISCGYDAYGWLIQFDNGTAMSLADVREFQLRKGFLPDRGGVIYYGENENVFKDIERIVIYQSTQYFSYGV